MRQRKSVHSTLPIGTLKVSRKKEWRNHEEGRNGKIYPILLLFSREKSLLCEYENRSKEKKKTSVPEKKGVGYAD